MRAKKNDIYGVQFDSVKLLSYVARQYLERNQNVTKFDLQVMNGWKIPERIERANPLIGR